MDKTYVMIKPDGVQRGLVGKIISRFEDKGMTLLGLKMIVAAQVRAGLTDGQLLALRTFLIRPKDASWAKVNSLIDHLSTLDRQDLLETHYEELKNKAFFYGLLEYVGSGPVVCMCWAGKNAPSTARTLIGATDPLKADNGTIRGDFGQISGRNVVHGSDSPGSADRELALWFEEGEVIEWQPAIQAWIHGAAE
jgi:nucleoside-diphosphate kinase